METTLNKESRAAIELMVADGIITKDIAEKYFPDLKASEDEKIIKELIEHLTLEMEVEITLGEEDGRRWINWLKNLSKKKINTFSIGDEIRTDNEEPLTITKIDENGYWSGDLLICGLDEANKWELDELKPDNNGKPKFNVGDWVVRGDTIAQILDIQEQYYVGVDINGKDFTSSRFLNNDKIHLWTIEDAKEGDVLATLDHILIFEKLLPNDGGVSYCHFDFGCSTPQFDFNKDDNWYFGKEAKVYPATKEQRDVLMKAMADAGYTFDFEKKELKKIEQNIDTKDISEIEVGELTEQNPDEWSEEDDFNLAWVVETLLGLDGDKKYTDLCKKMAKWLKSIIYRVQPKQYWSEEDERICLCLIEEQEKALDDVKNSKYGHQEIISDLKEIYRERINWLESFRHRNQWKPSEELMNNLSRAANGASYHTDLLLQLYMQLKQL
jgi:hypothetical protein